MSASKLQGGGVSDLTSSLLQQLDATCAEIDEQIADVRQEAERRVAELTSERARFEAARTALTSADAGPPAPVTVTPPAQPAPARPRAASTSAIAPADVLAFMRTLDGDWIGVGVLERAFDLGRKALRARLDELLSSGDIERRGVRSGTRYRLVGAQDPPEPEGDDDEDEPPPAAPPVSARVRRQLEHESKPAPPPPAPSLRPAGPALRRKVEQSLRRGACFPSELAKSLVIPMSEVSQQIAVLRELGGQGNGPKVLKHESGAYFIDEDEATKWPLERAA